MFIIANLSQHDDIKNNKFNYFILYITQSFSLIFFSLLYIERYLSHIRGVYLHQKNRKWTSYIKINKRTYKFLIMLIKQCIECM